MRRSTSKISVCLAILLAGACLAASLPAKQKPVLRDDDLRQAIVAKFAKSKAAAENFQVHVQGGTVTLTGKTDVVQRKAAATRMAKSAGAKQVVNKIQVSQEGRAKASQGIRRAQIKRSEQPPRTQARSEKR